MVKPAIIPTIFMENIFCRPNEIGELSTISGRCPLNERLAKIGKATERISDGIATHHNKEKFSLMDHFFTKIREIYRPNIIEMTSLVQITGNKLYDLLADC